MATFITEGKVQFQPLPATIVPTTTLEYVVQDSTVGAASGTATSFLLTDITTVVADSDGPSWIQLHITLTSGDIYRFWQAEVFYILDWLIANATFTPMLPPF